VKNAADKDNISYENKCYLEMVSYLKFLLSDNYNGDSSSKEKLQNLIKNCHEEERYNQAITDRYILGCI